MKKAKLKVCGSIIRVKPDQAGILSITVNGDMEGLFQNPENCFREVGRIASRLAMRGAREQMER